MTVPVQSQIYNPITGVFGTGQIQVYGPGQSGSWVVPPGIGKVRARCWGGGGNSGGGGGGFALKTIYDLSGVTSISIIVGGQSGTSSFGSYVSATGGASGNTGGSGSGGDINSSGGNGISGYAGGVGSLWGNGGSYNVGGASGDCASSSAIATPNGFLGASGYYNTSGTQYNIQPTSGMSQFSIDLIGIGGGGGGQFAGINGGGGYYGGFPGGGAIQGGANSGGPGLVIVEW